MAKLVIINFWIVKFIIKLKIHRDVRINDQTNQDFSSSLGNVTLKLSMFDFLRFDGPYNSYDLDLLDFT